MKKISSVYAITFALLLLTTGAQATTHTVTVQDYFFTPSAMTVTVGDTIHWTWISGVHTTTSGTIPGGAASWDAMINSSSLFFNYAVTAAGTYNYDCSVHPGLMPGSFTATLSTGISATVGSPFLIINSSLQSNELQITYKLEKGSEVTYVLLDMAGKQVDYFTSSFHTPGTYTETYSISNLSRGTYLLEFRAADMITSRKIVIE